MLAPFVMIVAIVQFYGPAVDHVPFQTAEACIAARDDMRKRGSLFAFCECYATGYAGDKGGRVDR